VKEAAVVGVWNSKEETEVPRAYIAINNSTERPTWNVIEELSQFVASKVSSYKRLRGVLIIKALPRNSNGKVLKSLLKENVQKHQTRRESLGKL
jgi:acyl-coenzyme A synthetase/AMP-(fatty) acid ligase